MSIATRPHAVPTGRAPRSRSWTTACRRATLAIAFLLPFATLDAEAGPRSRPIRTGQTTCYDVTGAVIACAGTRQDGDLKRGERRSYADEGNGTIRDKRAGLTWEKLSDDDTIHDKDNTYTWEQAFGKIETLNDTSFAGFDDWRLPNATELATLLDLGVVQPAISSAFQAGCTGGCTVLTCTCMPGPSRIFWTSTTAPADTSQAFAISFDFGSVTPRDKTEPYRVRAVRGGAN